MAKELSPSHVEDRETLDSRIGGGQPIADTMAYSNEEDYQTGVRTVLAVLALALANCNATLSNTTNTIIRYQVIAVGGTSVQSWIANGNFLLTLACAPIFGSLSDRLGKKWFIVSGCAVGMTGSFVSSSATSAYTLIGGNILVGIGNAGCIVSIAANQEIIPNKLRPYAFGFAQTINSASAIVGTFIAAVFAQHSVWQWSYRFNGIAFAVAGLAVLFAYQPPPTSIRRSTSIRDIMASIDYPGILLLAGSLTCLVMALTWGGSTFTWNSSIIVGLLAGGCIGLVAFGLCEWSVQKPLLDHRLFHNYNFPVLCFVCLIDGMMLLGINVLYAQEIPTLFNANAVRIAVILSPYLITSTLGCLPAGWIMGKTKSYRSLLVAALLWCSLFTGLMALITPTRLKWALAFTALFGVGAAITTVIPIVALALSVPSSLLGTAGTLSISARALGGITGITIFTAIYDNKYAVNLPKYVSDVLVQAGESQTQSEVLQALSSHTPAAKALATVPGLSPVLIIPILDAVKAANAASWKFVWVAIACVIFANAVTCCALKSIKPAMTTHVESALERGATRDEQMEMQIHRQE